jgi:hypothetical protein
MIPRAINSRIASYRSHSTMYRWISAIERRRESRRGGKSPASGARAFSLLPLSPFVPDQKAETEHDRQSLPMKPIPAATLVLIPSQLTFGFFVILLDPVTTVCILDHFGKCCFGREVTPEVLPLALLRTRRTLADQPAGMACSVTIHTPAAQGTELCSQLSTTPLSPSDRLPTTRRQETEQSGRTDCLVLCTPSKRDTEFASYRTVIKQVAIFQSIEKIGVVAIVAVTHYTLEGDGISHRFIDQAERDLGFGLKGNLFGM